MSIAAAVLLATSFLFIVQVYRVKRRLLPDQLSTINSLVVNAAQPFMSLTKRRSNTNIQSSSPTKEVSTINMNNMPKEKQRNIDGPRRGVTFAFDSQSSREDKGPDITYLYDRTCTGLDTITIQWPVKKESETVF